MTAADHLCHNLTKITAPCSVERSSRCDRNEQRRRNRPGDDQVFIRQPRLYGVQQGHEKRFHALGKGQARSSERQAHQLARGLQEQVLYEELGYPISFELGMPLTHKMNGVGAYLETNPLPPGA